MTNKERLELNNQKIDAIIQALEGKIAGDKVKEIIEVDLPDAFKTVSQVYNMKLNSNKFLFSGGMSTGFIGLWLYTVDTKEWKRLWSEAYYFYNFQQVSDTKWLVWSDSVSTILLFDLTTETVTRLPIYFNNQKLINVGNNKWLVASSSSSPGNGIFIYNSLDDSTKKIYGGNSKADVALIENNKFILVGPSILMYDSLDDSIQELYNDGNSWRYMVLVNDRHLFYSSDTAGGILVCNADTYEFSKIYEGAVKHTHIIGIFKDKVLMGGGGSSSRGLFVYDYSTNTASLVWNEASVYFWVGKQVTNDKVIISSYSNSGGILVYTISTNSAIRIESSINVGMLEYFQQVSDTKWLMSASSNYSYMVGIHLYDSSDDSYSRIYSSKYGWKSFKQVTEDLWLISNPTSSEGILKYTPSTDKVTSIFNYGTYDEFKIAENGNCYLYNSTKENGDFIVYYDLVDNAIKLDGYYLEV